MHALWLPLLRRSDALSALLSPSGCQYTTAMHARLLPLLQRTDVCAALAGAMHLLGRCRCFVQAMSSLACSRIAMHPLSLALLGFVAALAVAMHFFRHSACAALAVAMLGRFRCAAVVMRSLRCCRRRSVAADASP